MPETVIRVIQETNYIDIILTIATVVLSSTAIVISIISWRSQVTHNKNSVKPIIDIIFGDYESKIYIKIKNNGVGPAIITKACFLIDGIEYDNIMSAFYSHYEKCNSFTVLHKWTTFVENFDNRTIPPNGELKLLEYISSNHHEINCIRGVLMHLVVSVAYNNIYNDIMTKSERKCDLFGRNYR